jgi:hypothetical protein
MFTTAGRVISSLPATIGIARTQADEFLRKFRDRGNSRGNSETGGGNPDRRDVHRFLRIRTWRVARSSPLWLQWGCSRVTDCWPTNKPDCPHAMGTNAFSPQVAKVISSLSVLPSPHSTPSLRSVAQGRLRLFTTDASRRICESGLERRTAALKPKPGLSGPPALSG